MKLHSDFADLCWALDEHQLKDYESLLKFSLTSEV